MDSMKNRMTVERRTRITSMIGEWLCDAMLPYTTVDNEKLRAVFSELNPHYECPNEITFRRNVIPDMYRTYMYHIQEHLR